MRNWLPVSLKPNLPTGCLTRAELEQIVASVKVDLPDNVRMVQYSPTPPSDTTLPWQQIDSCGGGVVGTVKTFKNGAWQ